MMATIIGPLSAEQKPHGISMALNKTNNTAFSNRKLPEGFPDLIDAEGTIGSYESFTDDNFAYHLSDEDMIEIDSALAHFKGLNLDGDEIDHNNFPLTTLGKILEKLALNIHEGRGLAILRGIDNSMYSTEDFTLLFMAIGKFIGGKQGRQDQLGNLLVHVTDDGFSSHKARAEHIRYSHAAVPFHTDAATDILAFQTRSSAARGGEIVLSPAQAIYNVLAVTRPDIIVTLASPDWRFKSPYPHKRPVLFFHCSRLIINFDTESVSSRCTKEQFEALDVVQQVAESCALKIKSEPGDLTFFNNLALLHRREAFEDDKQQKRHLARMWLRNEKLAWKLPKELASAWTTAFGEKGERVLHVEPMPEGFFPLNKFPN